MTDCESYICQTYAICITLLLSYGFLHKTVPGYIHQFVNDHTQNVSTGHYICQVIVPILPYYLTLCDFRDFALFRDYYGFMKTLVSSTYPLALKLAGRRERILWPSSAEIAFAKIMRCWVIPIPFLRHPETGQWAVFIVMRGVMRREHMQREVSARGYFMDFGNDIKRGIEVDGEPFHKDIVKDYERDQHLAKDGWIIFRVPGDRLRRSPSRVRREVTEFLTH